MRARLGPPFGGRPTPTANRWKRPRASSRASKRLVAISFRSSGTRPAATKWTQGTARTRSSRLQPPPLPDHPPLDVGLLERPLVGLVLPVVGADPDARRLAVRQHLHALHDEAEPVPYDEDAGRRRRAVAGVDEDALTGEEARLHAVADHRDDAELGGGRRRVAAHDAARHLPLRHHLLLLADEPAAGAGAHVELLDS